MAEDAVDHAIVLARLPERPCITRELRIHGYQSRAEESPALSGYGSDAAHLEQLAREKSELAEPLHRALPVCGAQVVWAARHEMARTLDDVLARRTRALYLNARAAIAMAPAAARLLADELGRDESWQQRQVEQFNAVAENFVAKS